MRGQAGWRENERDMALADRTHRKYVWETKNQWRKHTLGRGVFRNIICGLCRRLFAILTVLKTGSENAAFLCVGRICANVGVPLWHRENEILIEMKMCARGAFA